ncbi:MAG: hypothetical protein LUM44_24285 [Pyrinomonadaceae bacterium]|nr:hypothetical protein [Pyrinomonadaceae bacterium]
MASVFPNKNSDKTVWLRTFSSQFALVAADFNFSPARVAEVQRACETVVYSIRLAAQAKQYAKACHEFRDTFLRKKSNLPQTAPEFKEITPPAELFPSNALAYIEETINLLKAQSNYTSATGALLGIVSAKADKIQPTDKPKVKLISLINSVIRINWKKGKAQAVLVESKRGEEENFTEIGRDQYSPFIDARPPLEHGKPELRFYRLTYLDHDKPVGMTSEIYSVTTNP